MEDTLFAIFGLIGVSIVSFSVIYITKFSGTKQRRAVKTVKEENIDVIVQSYANSIEVLKEQNEFLVSENKTIKKRLAAEIGVNIRSEQAEMPVETKINAKNLEEFYEIDVSNGLKLVESMNIPFLNNMDKSKIPELINNPIIKKKVWSYIKENKDEMINLGVIVPIGSMQDNKVVEKTKEESPSNDGTIQLEFSEDNAKYMA